MKLKFYIPLVLLIPFLWMACKPDPVDPPPPPPDPPSIDSSVVWNVPVKIDTTGDHVGTPFLFEDKIIYKQREGINVSIFIALNKMTGEEIWRRRIETGDVSEKGYSVSGSKMFLSDSNDEYTIDLNTGEILNFEFLGDLNCGSSEVSTYKDYGFHIRQVCGTNDDELLVKINLNTFEADTIYELYITEGFSPLIYSPNIWEHQGKEIVTMLIGWFNFSNFKEKFDLFAMDLITKDTVWLIKDVDVVLSGSSWPTLNFNDTLIFQATKDIICVDAKKGEILWQYMIDERSSGNVTSKCPISRNGDDLYILTESDYLVKLDIKTGDEIWKIVGTGDFDKGGVHGAGERLIVFENKLFLNSGTKKGDISMLAAVNPEDGSMLLHKESTNKEKFDNATFRFSGPVIDPSTGYLYIADEHFFTCYDTRKFDYYQ